MPIYISAHLVGIQAIYDWLSPTTLTDLCIFLGLENFYHRFVLGLSNIAWSISQVTKGVYKANFIYSKPQQHTFEDMKQRLCLAHILTLLYLQQPFDIETDESY